MEAGWREQMQGGGWSAGGDTTMDRVYNIGVDQLPLIFKGAGWKGNAEQAHIMGRSRLGAAWFQEESWLKVRRRCSGLLRVDSL